MRVARPLRPLIIATLVIVLASACVAAAAHDGWLVPPPAHRTRAPATAGYPGPGDVLVQVARRWQRAIASLLGGQADTDPCPPPPADLPGEAAC